MHSKDRHSSYFNRSVIFIFFSCIMLAFCSGGDARAEKDPEALREELAILKYKNDILDEKAQLAKSGKFYLITDLPEKEIHLMIRGVSLKTFPIERIEIGRRKLAFFSLPVDVSFQHIFEDGVVSPSRIVERYQIEPPSPEESGSTGEMNEEEPPPPPVPESKQIEVPHIFRIAFKDGFAFELLSTGVDEESPGFFKRTLARLRTKLSDIVSIFRKGRDVKLRAAMKPDDFRHFYRAVPDQVKMIVIFKPLS